MKAKKKTKKSLIDWREYRIRLLESERQNYENNPNFLPNVKMANAVLIQNEIQGVKIPSGRSLGKLRRSIRNSRKKS
jgi:hypothetical protein